MTENTLSPVSSISRPVNLVEPQEQVHLKPLSSVESPPGPVIDLPANQSNHVSMVTEPIEKMQQLPSS
ncbi:helicase protein MOM1-like, partial [Trifolium medium]|nr:helicase protein MOM1-like [Trifolium medium]